MKDASFKEVSRVKPATSFFTFDVSPSRKGDGGFTNKQCSGGKAGPCFLGKAGEGGGAEAFGSLGQSPLLHNINHSANCVIIPCREIDCVFMGLFTEHLGII